jgi:hypothetical protein
MASPDNAFVCALIATAFWPLLGYALGRRFLPRVLAIGTAPVIGWAVDSAVTLPIYLLFGFSPFLVAGIGAVCVLVAGFSLSQPSSVGETEPAPTIPLGRSPSPRSSHSFRRLQFSRSLPAMPSGLPMQPSITQKARSSMR